MYWSELAAPDTDDPEEKSRPVSLLLIRAITTTARSFKTSFASPNWLTAYEQAHYN